MDDYLQDFIRESEENITELNNSLLDLEDDPDDEAAMDSIFRTAHTLKGNFGAMGFDSASNLAHAMEDLLDEIRQGRMTVTPEIMDLVFRGVDGIDLALRQIDADGESSIEPTDTIDQIRGTIEDRNEASDGSEATDESEAADGSEESLPADDGSSPSSAVEEVIRGLREPSVLAGTEEPVLHVWVDMSHSQMKGVDAMLVLNDVTESFSLLAARPSTEAIQDGEYDESFDLFVESDQDPDDVHATFEGMGKVGAAEVTQVEEELLAAAAELSDAEEPESDGEIPDASEDADADDNDTDGDGSDDDGQSDVEETPIRSSEEIQSIRVDVQQLDDLHGLVEQLVTSRIKLRRSVEQGEVASAEDNLDELDKITSSLQDTVMDMRLVPLKKVVNKFPRMVRDISRSQDKEIDFVMEGEEIELDRIILNEISDPLMHLLRNAVDHGIGAPDEREEAGKLREGTITLRGRRERNRVTIEVEDDGRGLDVETLRSKAVEKGIKRRETVDEMDDADVYDLIFHPGFSTREEITDVSGRGVGMDVVNETITRLDGSITVDSDEGEGTKVSLTLPVTVAIVKVLFVGVGDEEYGIPIKNIDEISRLNGVKTIEGEEVITHDDSVYPLIRLGAALDVPGAESNGDGMLVRINEDERQVAIHCDAVSRQEEVVVKPFEGILSGIPGISGAAVLGEGDVVTILDVETL